MDVFKRHPWDAVHWAAEAEPTHQTAGHTVPLDDTGACVGTHTWPLWTCPRRAGREKCERQLVPCCFDQMTTELKVQRSARHRALDLRISQGQECRCSGNCPGAELLPEGTTFPEFSFVGDRIAACLRGEAQLISLVVGFTVTTAKFTPGEPA